MEKTCEGQCKMIFYIICVIYNFIIEETSLYKSLKNNLKNNYAHVNILFIDNSTEENILKKNLLLSKESQIQYFSMNGNKGISKAYNFAIKKIKKSIDSWILIFDQDTSIYPEFITKYEKNIYANPEFKIFCPVVKDKKGILSPCVDKKSRFVRISSSTKKSFSFINTGMCINSEIFNHVLYEENLFLDFVDHDFVRSVKVLFPDKKIFFVMNDVLLQQNFSGTSKNSFESDFMRFKILSNDAFEFFKKWNKHFPIFNAVCFLFLRSVKLSIHHKRIDFVLFLAKLFFIPEKL